jgi:hypothetical protein
VGQPRDGTIEIATPASVKLTLGLGDGDLRSEPLAFVDRVGLLHAPWDTACHVVRMICHALPQIVLDAIRDDQEAMKAKVVHGLSSCDNGYPTPGRIADRLRQLEPIHAMIRSWCGAEESAQFDDLAAVRAHNEELRQAIKPYIIDLEANRRRRRAADLRALIGWPRTSPKRPAPWASADGPILRS